MKRYICILFLFCISILTAKEKSDINNKEPLKPSFRFEADFHSQPFFYEPLLKLYGTSFNGAMMFGLKLDKFTIGIEGFENYISVDGKDAANHLIGAWNILRGTLDGYYEPLPWFELKWGIGAAWYNSSTKFNSNTSQMNTDVGGSAILNASFHPVKYFRIKLINSIDIFYHSKYNSIQPYYYGGVQLIVHPYLEWINLYIEAGAMPWFYKDDYVELTSGIFLWSAGVSLDIDVPNSFKNQGKKTTKTKVRKVDQKVLAENKDKLETLKKINEGVTMPFSSIKFATEETEELTPESMLILNEVAKILLTRKDSFVEIRAHTINTDNLTEQIELSRIRAEAVKYYLVKNKIEASRIYTFGFGSFYKKYQDPVTGLINQEEKIEIKLLSKPDIDNETSFDKLRNRVKDSSITFPLITFKSNSDELKKDSFPVLDKIAVILMEMQDIKISIEGVANDTGNPYEDLKLATKRSNSIKKYFVNKGINENRLTIPVSGKIYSLSNLVKESVEIKIIN